MRARIVVLVGLLLPVAAPAAAQEAAARSVGAYVGDVIRLTIWREPELSQLITVPPGGVVVFPKIGARQVVGRTLEELQHDIATEYRKYLINPSIRIEVLKKVTISGAVKNPNIYTLDATVSVNDAVAIAGGVTANGRPDRVELRRDGEVVEVILLGRTTLADSPVRSGDQLFVPERSYISRNGSTLAAVLSGGLGLLVALLAR